MSLVGGISGQQAIKEHEAKTRGGVSTERMCFPSKDGSLRFVPIVDLQNQLGDMDKTIYAYQEAGVSMDKTQWESFKKSDEDLENIGSYFTFPKLSEENSRYCIATWLEGQHKLSLTDPEVISPFANMHVPGSSMFKADPTFPLQVRDQHLIFGINLSDEDFDEENLKISVFKFGQKTILKGFTNIYKQTGGMFNGTKFSIAKDDSGKSYTVVNLSAYELTIPENDLTYTEFVPYDQEYIVKRLRMYGIELPDAEFFMPAEEE
jgi:hypothetical protein